MSAPVTPSAGGDVLERAVALVVIEAARLSHVRDEQVEVPVAVVVAPARALGAPLVEHAGLLAATSLKVPSPWLW